MFYHHDIVSNLFIRNLHLFRPQLHRSEELLNERTHVCLLDAMKFSQCLQKTSQLFKNISELGIHRMPNCLTITSSCTG